MTNDTLASDYSEWGERQFALNIRVFVDACRDIDAIPILMTQATLVSSDNRDETHKKIAYRYVGLTHGALADAFAACNRIIRAVAREKHVALIDLAAHLSGDTTYFNDHVHFSTAGSNRAAHIVADFLAENLASTIRSASATGPIISARSKAH